MVDFPRDIRSMGTAAAVSGEQGDGDSGGEREEKVIMRGRA